MCHQPPPPRSGAMEPAEHRDSVPLIQAGSLRITLLLGRSFSRRKIVSHNSDSTSLNPLQHCQASGRPLRLRGPQPRDSEAASAIPGAFCQHCPALQVRVPTLGMKIKSKVRPLLNLVSPVLQGRAARFRKHDKLLIKAVDKAVDCLLEKSGRGPNINSNINSAAWPTS